MNWTDRVKNLFTEEGADGLTAAERRRSRNADIRAGKRERGEPLKQRGHMAGVGPNPQAKPVGLPSPSVDNRPTNELPYAQGSKATDNRNDWDEIRKNTGKAIEDLKVRQAANIAGQRKAAARRVRHAKKHPKQAAAALRVDHTEYYDRLTSLLLGEQEQSRTPITDTLAKRRSRGEVAYDLNIDTAAAMGSRGRGMSRGRALGREVPDVGSMEDLRAVLRRRRRTPGSLNLTPKNIK